MLFRSRSTSGRFPEPPAIEINTQYNPFESDTLPQERSGFIDRFEREKVSNWEKLYSGLERNGDHPEQSDTIRESQRKFFQIKSKYIVCPVKSGLMLIDQKRAHERVLYEKYIESLNSERTVSQVDMFPVTVEVNPADYFILKEIEGELELLGFRIRHDGKNNITVTGRPSGSGTSDPVEMLEILLEDYKNTSADPSAGEKERVAASMAAASAIPYGKALAQSEMEDLFDTLFACSAPNYSPGGKPIITIFTIEDIDKRFK